MSNHRVTAKTVDRSIPAGLPDYGDPPTMKRLQLKRRRQKANGWGFPWTGKASGWEIPWTRMLVALLVLTAAAFVAHDVQSHSGSFVASCTGRFLHGAVTVYGKPAFAWLRANLPLFFAECARVLRPLAEQARQKARVAARAVSKQIVWLAVWVNTNGPVMYQQALERFKEQSLFVHESYVLPVGKYVTNVLLGAWKGLQS